MKKIYIAILSGLLIISCDILEPDPQQSLDSDTALVDAASAEGILIGTYSMMQDQEYYGAEYILNSDLLADNSVFEGFFDSQLELDQKAVPITNLWIEDIWPDIYKVISSANLLITGLDAIEDPALENGVREEIIGEAHAVRALAYFDLLRYFGEHYNTASPFGLPLFLETVPDNDFNQIPDIPRSSVSEVYDQIIGDLDTAITLTEGSSDPGRMNFWAALSLRARVNLYRGEYAQAFADADQVITQGPFALEANLDDVFYTTDPSQESIFEVEYNDQDQSDLNDFTIGRDEYNVDPSLLDFFEEDDLRSAYFDVIRNRDRTLKYSNPNNANNAKVLRLAELYLIRSEAAVFANNDPTAGTEDLNVLRERAGLEALEDPSSIEDYLDALLYERRAELNFEGHRFFDLVRLGRAEETLELEAFRQIMPIPRNELQVSDALEQNPGYSTD